MDKPPRYYANKLVEHLGFNSGEPVQKILENLQTVEALEIQSLAYFLEEFIRAPYPFKPMVDGGLVDDPFLPEEPLELLSKGHFNKVPLMIGTNQNEGLLIKGFYEKNIKKYDEAFDNWDAIGPLAFFHREKDEHTKAESEICREYLKKHFGELRFSSTGKASEKLVQMYGDVVFTGPADHATKLITEHKDAPPVYQYVYNHQGPLSLYDVMALPPWKSLIKLTSLTLGFDLFKSASGVCHGDELFMMFTAAALPFSCIKSADDRRVSENLVNLWTDFASYHNPTPEDKNWTRFDPKDPKYLEIGSKCNTMKYPEDHKIRMDEWKEICNKVPPTMCHKKSPTWKEVY